MQTRAASGPDAASLKYDLITALGAFGLASDAGEQRLVLRLITLVTARYNWRLATLSVGQCEIARLWSVDERTVKREMARLRAKGWLVMERAARRGRVASYRLDLGAVHAATRPAWARVGCDFEARMAARGGQGRGAGAAPGNIVPFPRSEAEAEAPDPSDPSDPADAADAADDWAQAREILRREEPALFGNWIEGLTREGGAGGRLALRAPSAFHASYVRMHFADRLRGALRRAGAELQEIAILP